MGKIGEMAEFLLRAMVEEGEAEDGPRASKNEEKKKMSLKMKRKTKGFRCRYRRARVSIQRSVHRETTTRGRRGVFLASRRAI